MNNLMKIENNSVNLWEQNDQLRNIKEIYGKNLSDGEFTTLVQIGKATGLNPFLRELWAVKYGQSPAQIFIGRDGYRKSAQSHPLYDYHMVDAVYSNDTFEMITGEVTHKYNFKDRGQLIGAYCLVKRKDATRPIFIFVELKEYSTGKSLWAKEGGKPATMIKKVAEAQGLRMAFQSLFGGTYDESETYLKSNPPFVKHQGINGLKEKLNMMEKKGETVDGETGEVLEEKCMFSYDEIKNKIEEAHTIHELIEAADLARNLPQEERKSMRVFYKNKEMILNKTD